jgi:hypothetical protein
MSNPKNSSQLGPSVSRNVGKAGYPDGFLDIFSIKSYSRADLVVVSFLTL